MNKKINKMLKTIFFIGCCILATPNMIHAQVYADSQINGRDSLCLTCTVLFPNNSVDGNAATYSQINLADTIPGASIYQRLGFSSAGNAGNNVGIIIKSYDFTSLDSSALAGLTLCTFNNGVSNNDTLNSSQFSISQVDSSTHKYTIGFIAANYFNAVQLNLERKTIGGSDSILVFNAYHDANVLAVGLIDFTGTASNNSMDLTWSTATETDNAFFIVEKSADGINFSTLDTVKGIGNSSITSKYSCRDKNPSAGTSYYRLKQHDLNGISRNLKIIAVEYTPKEIVEIFPNPSAGENIRIRLNCEEDAILTICDRKGETIFSQTYHTNDSKQDFSYPLPSGIYYLRLVSGNQTQIKKIIILN